MVLSPKAMAVAISWRHQATQADGCPWNFGRVRQQVLQNVPCLTVVEPPLGAHDERRDRTAVLSCPRRVSASFDRRDVVTVLRRVVGLNKVTTIGQLEGNRWEVVLIDDNALKKFTDMVTIDIKGVAVDVSAVSA